MIDCDCEDGVCPTTPEYTTELFPYPPNATDEQRAEVDARRRLYPVFYFPCPKCRPAQFLRWQNGCFRPNHKAATCELCIEQLGEEGARRFGKVAQGATPR